MSDKRYYVKEIESGIYQIWDREIDMAQSLERYKSKQTARVFCKAVNANYDKMNKEIIERTGDQVI